MKRHAMTRGIVAVISAMAIFGCSDVPDTIPIGVIFPMSGDAGTYGEKGELGIRLAVDDINQGRLAGRWTIRAVIEDSQASPTVGAAAMQKLVNVDRVPAVVGDIVSAVTLAAAPIAERSGVVLLSPTSSAPAITTAGDFVFRIWPSDLAEGAAIAEAAASMGFTRAAILHLNNDYGLSISNRFSEVFGQLGGQVVVTEAYLDDAGDYRTALARVASRTPDVIYIAGYYRDTALIVRQARESGLQQQLLATTAIEDPAFLELTAGAAEGLVYPLATGFDAAAPDSLSAAFVQRFEARFDTTPSWVEAHAYEAMVLLARVISEIPSDVTGVEIRNRLVALGPYTGVTGTFTFDANGDVTKPVSLKTVRNGSFVGFEPR